MICKNPFVSSAGRVFGCGQCMPCRFNKRRIWAHRIMLEAGQYGDNTFATLSYSDEKLPVDGSVKPKDLQDWLKRLRKAWSPNKLRFFAVGEYGDNSLRPHYHVALFNFPNCQFGQSNYGKYRSKCCQWCDLVSDSWGHGNIFLGALEPASAGYVAGYVTKKLTDAGDPRLEGRHPEFARMSLRPGIGGDATWEIADVVLKYDLGSKSGDVPTALRHGRKELPLGRYLVQRVRVMSGYEKGAPQIVVDKIDAEMLPLREAVKADNENPSLKDKVLEFNRGKLVSFEARERIYRQRRSL